MVNSTMTRARETAEIIAEQIGPIPNIETNSLIEEGQPIAPDPPGKVTTDDWVNMFRLRRIYHIKNASIRSRFI